MDCMAQDTSSNQSRLEQRVSILEQELAAIRAQGAPKLEQLPNGYWIELEAVIGVRLLVGDKLGPRVVLDTRQCSGHTLLEFDNPEAARAWAAEFGQKRNLA
jgi:hypothetical protein